VPDRRPSNRPATDSIITTIADYVLDTTIENELAYTTARYCLLDSLSCAMLALNYPACRKLLGPIVPGVTTNSGTHIPGTHYVLDPVQAAFNIGAMIRWLDYNDTWLAAEWAHPSDNFAGILALADYLSRQDKAQSLVPGQVAKKLKLSMRDVLTYAIKAYEIQGILALENSFNRVGLDHVILVRIATTAVATAMLGGNREQIINAVSNAWLDGGALRTYRHAPNTGSRKSWAAGDASSRGVRLALIAMTGEMGYPSALSAQQWGFYDVLFKRNTFSLPQAFSSYVMQNILFKISFPAEFHAQTAVESALVLHCQVKNRLHEIDKIVIETQQAGMRIIDKSGDLHNPADRDHCMQYMVAIALIFGRLVANDYEDEIASDTRIDALRDKMQVQENLQFSQDYLDPEKRAIGNAIQVFFEDGSSTERIVVDYPLGHKRRRPEAIPLLMQKFADNIKTVFGKEQINRINALVDADEKTFQEMQVDEFMDVFFLG